MESSSNGPAHCGKVVNTVNSQMLKLVPKQGVQLAQGILIVLQNQVGPRGVKIDNQSRVREISSLALTHWRAH